MKQWSLRIATPDGVYPPSDDTYLLADAIELTPKDSFLEVGCGSGYITINAAMIASRVVAIDIILEALQTTLRNAQENGVAGINTAQGDLLTAIHPKKRFSVIAFNPPYLPADTDSSDLDFALVGGLAGTELTERFLTQAAEHLTTGGSVYVVASSLANIKRVGEAIEDVGLKPSVVATKKLFYETICVLRGTNEHKETVL